MILFRKIGISLFAIVAMGIVILDTTPERVFSFHSVALNSAKKTRQAIYPVLKRVGVHQGSWRLFAPDPDRVNTRIQANLYLDDDSVVNWRSPDYLHVSPLEKFGDHRRQELFDNLQSYQFVGGDFPYKSYYNTAYFDSFCRYLARGQEGKEPGKRVARIELKSIRSVIPEPSFDKPLLPVGGAWVDQEEEYLTSVMYDIPYNENGIELEPWPPMDSEDEQETDESGSIKDESQESKVIRPDSSKQQGGRS